jgi:hypothetical protein
VDEDEAEIGRPLRAIERQTLEILLSVDFEGVAQLRAQVPVARYAGSRGSGSAPSFDITVPEIAPRSVFTGKLVPVTAHVFDSSGEYTGEFILWLTDGYLSGVEYAWVTDEAPHDLPDPSTIQVSIRS